MRSPYAVLGIAQSAKDNDIKLAYRKLAKVWHPDQNHSDPRAQDVFAEINNAYQLLIDTPRRKLFDLGKIDANGRRRKTRTVVNTGFNPFKNFKSSNDAKGVNTSDEAGGSTAGQANGNSGEEKFGDKPFFANKAAPKTEPKPTKPFIRSVNKNAPFDDQLNEIFGSEDERIIAEGLAAERRQTQSGNSQSGNSQSGHRKTNYHEDAMSVLDDAFTKFEKNRATSTTRAPDRHFDVEVELVDIFTGVTQPVQPHIKNSLNVHIPAGTPEGSKITIENMGGCRKGEIPGDVVVTVRYKSNEQFWVRNGELHTHLAIDLADAVLGGEVTAHTPEGPATFMLPEWTSSNHIIRIPKHGLPLLSGERGDLCANVCILLPEKQNEGLKKVLRDNKKSWFM